MYESGEALGKQNQKAKSPYSTPQYGGDCALQPPDGLSSSTKRLQSVIHDLNVASWNLREFFGMTCPECGNDAPRPSGFKADVDEMVVSARASLENIQLVLEHLRS